jgi:RNA polymerase sigma-70 factor (ECF subfamily)
VRASAFGVAGRYQLEAALQSAHVNGRRAGRPDWPALLALYDVLLRLSGSPVVAINRALALAHVAGAADALAALDALSADGRLAEYQPYWAARAELLARAGARSDAKEAYARAVGLERDSAVRQFLQRRLAALS